MHIMMFKTFKRNSFLKSIKDGIFTSSQRLCSVKIKPEATGKKPLTFRQEVQQRYHQANNTVLVQVNHQKECYDLYDEISKLGTVRIMYHYETKERSQFALIEMDDATSVKDIFKHAKLKTNVIGLPSSNFFSYEAANNKVRLMLDDKLSDVILLQTPIYSKSESPSFNFFEDVKLFNERLLLFYEQSKIDDLNHRLRFFTAKQIESPARIINPTINVLPTGSSINGFGNKNSDADFVAIPKLQTNDESRLMFHMKTLRDTEAAHLNIIHKLIHHTLPGCVTEADKLARGSTVIRYNNQFTSLNCYFTLYNYESLMMTEILHLISSVDIRIKLLASLILRWGHVMSLTKKLIYEKCISNHTLILLIVFFLQQKHLGNPPLLLPIERANRKKTQLLSTNEKYLSNLKLFQQQAAKNKLSIEELTFLFFQYYFNFNFDHCGLSIKTGQIVNNIDSSCGLFLESPFHAGKNLCESITSREIRRFQESVKDMHQKLEVSFNLDLLKEHSMAENPRSIRN